ncbi:MAG: hypothetical protein ACREOW_06430 [Thermodesulfobacteriota bacterium]
MKKLLIIAVFIFLALSASANSSERDVIILAGEVSGESLCRTTGFYIEFTAKMQCAEEFSKLAPHMGWEYTARVQFVKSCVKAYKLACS